MRGSFTCNIRFIVLEQLKMTRFLPALLKAVPNSVPVAGRKPTQGFEAKWLHPSFVRIVLGYPNELNAHYALEGQMRKLETWNPESPYTNAAFQQASTADGKNPAGPNMYYATILLAI